MTGYEFEDFLVDPFTKLGYTVEQRKKSHEQGLDLLLLRYGERTAMQVKCYSNPVGNKAIQEVNTARMYYHFQGTLVVTNASFTTPAKELAERCDVELWDRKKTQRTNQKNNITIETYLFSHLKFDQQIEGVNQNYTTYHNLKYIKIKK